MKRWLFACIGALLATCSVHAEPGYYVYANFGAVDGFRGGYDVDGYGNSLYVNFNGTTLDKYQVTLHNTDGDAYPYEPDQHPSNSRALGPMEARTLSRIASYSVPQLAQASKGEMYATADGVYFLGDSDTGSRGDIWYYALGGTATKVVDSTGFAFFLLGGDEKNGIWYAANDWLRSGETTPMRSVYSWTGSTWQLEFSWEAYPGGDHADGLEVVVDPSTGTPYVYVSDMYADYLGQWYKDARGNWVKLQDFSYPGQGSTLPVEGMGFGPLNHFWVTGGNRLYEIGGGELGGYLETIPAPGAILLGTLGTGLVGWLRRRRTL